MKTKTVLSVALTTAACALLAHSAEARDFVGAASQYTSYTKTVSKVLALSGVPLGGLMMQFPKTAPLGTAIAVGSVVGTIYMYSTGALQTLMTTVFGSM